MTRVLAVRLDSVGDVLLMGPAIRSLAAGADSVDVLAAPAGVAAARLLPDVDDVLVLDAPWSGYAPPPVDDVALAALVREVATRRYDRAVVLTSFHQSPLPAALLLKLAGVRFVAADCEDYPGSLLDLRHRRTPGLHEVEAALELALAAGGRPVEPRLAVRGPLPDVSRIVPARPYVVVHPGASVPARAPEPWHARELVAALAQRWRVVVTGGPDERPLTAEVASGDDLSVDLTGRTDLPQLAAVLARASAVVVGNTAPAHLATAVGTPVVSLFAPVVPAPQWRPYGVDTVVLGDQTAACAGTRARTCPTRGHPCLSSVRPSDVVDAVDRLLRTRREVPA